MDSVNANAWVGREAHVVGQMTHVQTALVHATLGEGEPPQEGDVLPPLWHWCAFPKAAQNSLLGQDGHPTADDLLPPVPLPRRMWAAGSLRFLGPLRIGETLQRKSRVRSVSEKVGRTGPMIFVTLDHEIHGEQGLAIEERQDIVYLEIPERFSAPEARKLPAKPHESVETPETLLFRYSAITFNAHRIHYDLPYTQQVEKYPGLVVHGPLQATLLMRAAVRHMTRPPNVFEFRGVHPMFAGTPCSIAMREEAGSLDLWTGQEGHQCMQARATWGEII